MVAHPVDEDVAMSGDAYVSPDRWAAARWPRGPAVRSRPAIRRIRVRVHGSPQRADVGSVED